MASTTYNATVASSKFHASDAFVRLQLGPVRCGKTVSSCAEIWRRACEQESAPDGIRYSRWAIFRNTYPELKMTTIKTWLDWFPEKIYGKVKWDSPITQVIEVKDLRVEIIFVSLDRPEDISKLLSLELTGCYFNELQFIPELIFDAALKRVHQYPPKKMGVPITWGGVIADTNPPDVEHWIYQRFETKRPNNHEIFKYDPAVVEVGTDYDGSEESAVSLDGIRYVQNKNADYIKNLQKSDYYINGVQSSTTEDIKVFFQGEYGIVRKNKRVYPEYNDQIHCVPSIAYGRMTELGMGWDFGNTPAVVFCQLSVHGHFMILDELVCEGGGLDAFCSEIVVPHLNQYYPGWQNNFKSVGDPAGIAQSPTDAKTCFQILDKNGIRTCAAKTNALIPRKEAVSFFLRRMSGGRPSLMISPKAIVVRKGFNGDYFYQRVQVKHDERYKEEPYKNYASHPHDALQYIAMEYQTRCEMPRVAAKELLTGTLIS